MHYLTSYPSYTWYWTGGIWIHMDTKSHYTGSTCTGSHSKICSEMSWCPVSCVICHSYCRGHHEPPLTLCSLLASFSPLFWFYSKFLVIISLSTNNTESHCFTSLLSLACSLHVQIPMNETGHGSMVVATGACVISSYLPLPIAWLWVHTSS